MYIKNNAVYIYYLKMNDVFIKLQYWICIHTLNQQNSIRMQDDNSSKCTVTWEKCMHDLCVSYTVCVCTLTGVIIKNAGEENLFPIGPFVGLIFSKVTINNKLFIVE